MIKSIEEFVKALESQIGNKLDDKDYCALLGYSRNHWCVDFGREMFKECVGNLDGLGSPCRDVGTLADIFYDMGGLIDRQAEVKVGDICIISNSPNTESWRSSSNRYDGIGWFPDLDHFAWVVDVSHNDDGRGYITCIAGNEGGSGDDASYWNSSKVRKTNYYFNRQALYCRPDWDKILKGGYEVITGTLRKTYKGNPNNRGGQVKTIERILKILCYYKGDVTGNFGDELEKSVIAFQKKHADTCGKADGIVGAKTWKQLLALDTVK